MRLPREKQPRSESACASHEWQPLFQQPSRRENVLAYMSHRHADFKQCIKCGAVGMDETGSARRVHLLSESFANSKKREAAAWNAKQQEDAQSTQPAQS